MTPTMGVLLREGTARYNVPMKVFLAVFLFCSLGPAASADPVAFRLQQLYMERAGNILSFDDITFLRDRFKLFGDAPSYASYIFKNAQARALPLDIGDIIRSHLVDYQTGPQIRTTIGSDGIRIEVLPEMDDLWLKGAIAARERERFIAYKVFEKEGLPPPDGPWLDRLILAAEWEWWNLFTLRTRQDVKRKLNILANRPAQKGATHIALYAQFADHVEFGREAYIEHQMTLRRHRGLCEVLFQTTKTLP